MTYWQVPGIGVEPEYFFYSQFVYNPFSGTQPTPALLPKQVMYIADKQYTYNGLGSTYNAKHLYFDYITNTYKNPTAYMIQTAVAWGYQDPMYVYQILNTLEWLI